MYDIFYVSRTVGNRERWEKVKDRYPAAQRVDNVSSLDQLKSKSFTKMFWVIWDDLELTDFDLTEYRATKWDDMYVHVFKNGEHFDGVCLFPKNLKASTREFYHRFFIEKKEVDILASNPCAYPVYSPNTYDEYLEIKDEMFWIKWPEIEIIEPLIFNLYFSHHNSYDRRENHVFKNLCNDQESYLSGLLLCSKYKQLSKREFEKQYAVDKKEHNQIVSRYRYPRYTISSYDDYQDIINTTLHKMFWCVWPELEITDHSIFDLYFDPNDGSVDYDRIENHVFKNLFKGEETYVNGIVLFSKQKPIGKREFVHRFLIEKKEHDRLVSKMKTYDVVFISYNEPNADENYTKLLERCPRAKRVHGVKGIHRAHIRAAELCQTDMFWVVDGDAVLEPNFEFDYELSTYERDIVHVWRSKNPVNELVYGYGGVKLLPRELTLAVDVAATDMTTSISKKFKAVPEISNVTAFNTDPFNTWKSAFRECVKLASKVINNQIDNETQERLNVWTSSGVKKPFGEYAIAGAKAGRDYGLANAGNPEALSKINDFDWLKRKFDEI